MVLCGGAMADDDRRGYRARRARGGAAVPPYALHAPTLHLLLDKQTPLDCNSLVDPNRLELGCERVAHTVPAVCAKLLLSVLGSLHGRLRNEAIELEGAQPDVDVEWFGVLLAELLNGCGCVSSGARR